MARIEEIAPRIYQISTYSEQFDLHFNQYLILDEEPMLYHTGMRGIFPGVRDAMKTVMDPAKLRWIASSHFEADECGALNHWLAIASNAEPMASLVCANVSLNDFADRSARALGDGETFSTGQFQWQFLSTPEVPHAWDAGHLFEQTQRTMLCGDIFTQENKRQALVEDDIVGPSRDMIVRYESTPFKGGFVYAPWTDATMERLANLNPTTLATMHGSAFRGDGAKQLREMAAVWREVLGAKAQM